VALNREGLRVAVLGATPATVPPKLDRRTDGRRVSCAMREEDGATLGPLGAPFGEAFDPQRLREVAGSLSGHLDIRELKQLVGDEPDVIVDFLNEFRSSATRLMHSLHAVVSSKSWWDARGIVHRLKSSSRSVGARRMGDLCEQMESLTGSAGAAQQPVLELLAELEKEWSLVSAEIVQCMNQQT
jgi:HPt (histidine-containing phosphotransfer) domain-containing protein